MDKRIQPKDGVAMEMYSIKDNKVGTFNKPFSAVNKQDATRMLHTACNDPQVQLSMYPEDFDLYHVATFNEQTGHITGPVDNNNRYDGPLFIVSAISLKKIEVKNG